MAGEANQVAMSGIEARVRAMVAGLNPSALETLANKGLLRRAQKDIERGISVGIEREENGALVCKVDPFEVWISESGPAKAQCSCPAAGVCQHILIAVLVLQQTVTTEEESCKEMGLAAIAEREALALTREQIEVWAGKGSFRGALELASRYEATVTLEKGLSIQFPGLNVCCHYFPGGGLDGIIVSGNAKDARIAAAGGVIALQKCRGVSWEETGQPEPMLEESEGSPRSRADVLVVARQLLIEMVDNGLTRASSTTHQRLSTLAVSATGVNLPRLSLALRSLADECVLFVARDARSDLQRMLNRMAHTHALCAALLGGGSSSRPDLIGWNRTQYQEVGHLDLIGAAAWPWRTSSGYAGLTLLFWDSLGQRWNSWSESRPNQNQQDFDPVGRFTQPGPWEGCESPGKLSRSCFRLTNARRNPGNRLSSSGKSRVLLTGTVDLGKQGLPVIRDWRQLLEVLHSKAPIGLREINPWNSIYALQPADWDKRNYNSVTQVFSWMLLDDEKRPLLLEIAFDSFTERAIHCLENLSTDTVQNGVVIGRVQKTFQGLSLFPYTIHRGNGEVIHLCLDAAKSEIEQMTNVSEKKDEFDVDLETENAVEEGTEPAIIKPSPISHLLYDLDEILMTIAEKGAAGSNSLRIGQMAQISDRALRSHLITLAQVCKNFIVEPGAAALLRCVYLTHLHRTAQP
jgi:hypothetical protein